MRLIKSISGLSYRIDRRYYKDLIPVEGCWWYYMTIIVKINEGFLIIDELF